MKIRDGVGYVTGEALYGRDAERRLLADFVRGGRDRGGALVVRGEAGIGKWSGWPR